jgi:hypothetical protein
LRFAPLTAIQLVAAVSLLLAAVALEGASLLTTVAVGSSVIIATCVARLIGVDRPG